MELPTLLAAAGIAASSILVTAESRGSSRSLNSTSAYVDR
jgi:hypothetical protein